jgi:hypothetical protein
MARRTTTRARRASSLKAERSLIRSRQTNSRLREASRRNTKIAAVGGGLAGIGGLIGGELIERRGWAPGGMDARIWIGGVPVVLGGGLMLSKRVRRGGGLIIAVVLLLGGLGVIGSWLFSMWTVDAGMYGQADDEIDMLGDEDAEWSAEEFELEEV